MRNGRGSVSAFLIGAAAGAMAVEAAMYMAYPHMKRQMLRKGMRVLHMAKNIGSRIM